LVRVKIKRFADRVAFHQVEQQLVLVRAVHEVHVLIDGLGRGALRRHFNLHRVGEDAVGQLRDLRRHGGAEEQGLALLRQLGDHLLHVVDEAHVQHAVGFIEYEDLQARSRWMKPWLIRSSKRPGVATTMSTPRWSASVCGFLANATEDHGVFQLQVAAVRSEAFADLDGQLACRSEDQRPDGALGLWCLGMQFLQDRDREGGGFTGAGLCATQQVASLDQMCGMACSWIGVGWV
jgi:hypothetical protein